MQHWNAENNYHSVCSLSTTIRSHQDHIQGRCQHPKEGSCWMPISQGRGDWCSRRVSLHLSCHNRWFPWKSGASTRCPQTQRGSHHVRQLQHLLLYQSCAHWSQAHYSLESSRKDLQTHAIPRTSSLHVHDRRVSNLIQPLKREDVLLRLLQQPGRFPRNSLCTSLLSWMSHHLHWESSRHLHIIWSADSSHQLHHLHYSLQSSTHTLCSSWYSRQVSRLLFCTWILRRRPQQPQKLYSLLSPHPGNLLLEPTRSLRSLSSSIHLRIHKHSLLLSMSHTTLWCNPSRDTCPPFTREDLQINSIHFIHQKGSKVLLLS